MIMYVHRIIYKMSMLVCVYYAPMFTSLDKGTQPFVVCDG